LSKPVTHYQDNFISFACHSNRAAAPSIFPDSDRSDQKISFRAFFQNLFEKNYFSLTTNETVSMDLDDVHMLLKCSHVEKFPTISEKNREMPKEKKERKTFFSR